MLKFLFKIATWLALHIFYILPVKENQIFFRAFHGKKYDCNPKYLFLYMLKKYGDSYTYIWELGDAGQVINGASSVRRLSIKSFMAMMTSKYIVTNNDFMWWIPLRRSQVMLETWHGGGAYKRVGLYEKWSRLMLLDQKWNAKQITHYISSSCKFTEVQASSKWVPEYKFINTGMPRNEIFFYPEKMAKLKQKVFSCFGLSLNADIKVALYAPTYRGLTGYKESWKDSKLTPDYKKLLNSLVEKYGGKWVLFFRSHYFDSRLIEQLPDSVVDATKYEDMQELLCAADVLITDYSSSMWDFALTGKPCFLYAPDLQEYIADRGFYTDPFTWPFPIAQNDAELSRNILSFDEAAYKKSVQKHLADFGSYENKDACTKVCEAIGIK